MPLPMLLGFRAGAYLQSNCELAIATAGRYYVIERAVN